MAPKIDQLKSDQIYSNTRLISREIPVSEIIYVPINGDVAFNEGYADELHKAKDGYLTREEKARLNAVYKKIEEICKDYSIDLNDAKSFGMLEQILGCSTKELLSKSDAEINNAIVVLKDALSEHWKFDILWNNRNLDDIKEITDDAREKYNLSQVGGSTIGQIWHNIKAGAKNVFGLSTIDNCKTPEEISNYYKTKYLEDIENKTKEEKEEIYKNLLKDFYYDFNNCKSNEKKIAMVKAIKNLAAKDRTLIIDVIERSFTSGEKALTLLGKALNENFESIVMSKDANNETLSKNEASKVAHTAFKHMTEEDIRKALDILNKDADAFYKQYGQEIENLKTRKANGEELSPAEEELLSKSEKCFEFRFSGAITGTVVNAKLNTESKAVFVKDIYTTTEALGIHEEVLNAVAEFTEENPDVINMNPEEFKGLMDDMTDGKYSEIVYNTESKSNSEIKEPLVVEQSEYKPENSTITTSEISDNTAKSTTEKDNNVGFTNRNSVNPEKLIVLTKQIQNKEESTRITVERVESEPSVKKEETEKTTTKSIVEIAKGSNNELLSYINDKGAVMSLVEIYNNIGDIKNKTVLTFAQKIYTMLSASKQKDVLESIKSINGFNELLSHTSSQAIMKLKTNFSNHYTNRQVELAQEKVEKRRQHGLA